MTGWLLLFFIVTALAVGASPAAIIFTAMVVVGLTFLMDR